MNIQEALNLGLQRHQAGQIAEAQALYRLVLAQSPHHPAALHLLGLIAYQNGQAGEAVDLIRRAIQADPNQAEFHGSLGLALAARGELEGAVAAHRRALRMKPELAQVHGNLAAALAELGRFDEAIAAAQRAVALRPQRGDFHFNLANILRQANRVDESISSYRKALEIQPNWPHAWNNLGAAWQAKGNLSEAIAAYRQAVAHKPDFASAHRNLGRAFRQLNDYDASIEHSRRAIALAEASPPTDQEAAHIADDYNTLGSALRGKGELDQAVAAYQAALTRQPDRADALNNLAEVHRETGRLGLAIECFNTILQRHPGAAEIDSSRVYSLHFDSTYDAAALLREHRLWNERHAKPLENKRPPHEKRLDPNRRIRVGYISPDLRNHVVGWNLLPLLSRHDKERFEIFAYAHLAGEDSATKQLRAHCDVWRNIYTLDDAQTAELIRADKIDILVDLSLHMARNRLLVFARKPAPVQITYLGYCSTTGLDAMDYRLSDPHLDPPETDLSVYTEQTLRLPTSYWCYHPAGAVADISPSPVQTNGYVTFGCMNHFGKVSVAVMNLWAQVLAAIPKSRLLVHCPQGSHRQEVLDLFAKQGVPSSRLDLVGYQSWADYIQTFNRIDVALDPFPYGGGITGCDGLWMGVPMITLSGRTAVGRGGRSILANIGLPQLIASTPQEYIELAEKHDEWVQLRPTLRGRMSASPLVDAGGLAREVESAYSAAIEKTCL